MKSQAIVRVAVLLSVIIILALLTIYVVVITDNIPFSAFNWNQPPKENSIPMILPYPDNTVVTLPGTNFVATFTLQYNGTLAENTPIQIVNASCVAFTDHGFDISVGFSESFLTTEKSILSSGAGLIGWSGSWCVSFSQKSSESNATVDIHQVLPEKVNEIYFPVSGDYSPTILVTEGGNTTQYTYNEIKVNVLPASTVEAENTNKLNLGLTWALLGFSYIGGIISAYQLMGKQEKKAHSPEAVNSNDNHNPEGDKKKQQTTLPEDKKEEKNDLEKLIDWEQNKQLTWAVVLLTSVLGLAGLFVVNQFSIGKEVVAVILSVALMFLVNLSFYRLASSLVLLRHHIERIGQISDLYKQELIDNAMFKGLYGWFVDAVDKDNPRLKKARVFGVLTAVDFFIVALILGILGLL